jgi:hypothetical protein
MIAYCVWGVRRLDPLAVEQEADGIKRLGLAFAKGHHQLLQLGVPLDLEEDLIVVVGNLDVEMFRLGLGRIGSDRLISRRLRFGHLLQLLVLGVGAGFLNLQSRHFG